MSFNSLAFAIFLPISFFLYWIVPKKRQWVVLLLCSYYFYMSWNIKYIFLILIITVFSWGCGLALMKANSKIKKKMIVGCAVTVCLGILFVFKYYNFFSDVACNALQIFAIQLHPMTLKLLLPVGISFYTFQTLSYVIDIYYGKVYAEKNLGKYATFVAFFPQLVAGPIERAENLLPQMNQEHFFNYNDAVYGLRQMLWGFFKKIVIADTLANYVDLVYDSVYSYQGASLAIASFFLLFKFIVIFPGIRILQLERQGCLGYG